MIRALALALLLAAPAQAQLTIAGAPVAEGDILDARALPDISGEAGVMITFAKPPAPGAVTLDGQPVADAALADGVLTLPGPWPIPEAEALAKRLSGKDPLPEEFAE